MNTKEKSLTGATVRPRRKPLPCSFSVFILAIISTGVKRWPLIIGLALVYPAHLYAVYERGGAPGWMGGELLVPLLVWLVADLWRNR